MCMCMCMRMHMCMYRSAGGLAALVLERAEPTLWADEEAAQGVGRVEGRGVE